MGIQMYTLTTLIALTIVLEKHLIVCFFAQNWHSDTKKYYNRVYVSRPAQKKNNQLKTKIIINKKKKEENAKNKSSQNEYKYSTKYKLIEDVISEYPYELPDCDIENEPFTILKDKIKSEYLKGYKLPFNLIDPVKYELLKLVGKICDPFKPLCSYSLTPKLFIDKMFTNKYQVSYNDFCYNLEYKIKFYMPSYTEVFMYEKELLWKQWMSIRNLKEVSAETPLDNHDRIIKILNDDETTLQIAIIKVNREINSQGIHPAILKMFFDFLNIEKFDNKLKRDNAFLKLETIKYQIKNRNFMEGIRPDYLYFMLNNKAQEYYSNFNPKEYEKTFLESINYNTARKNMISENSIYKKQRREFSEKTKKVLNKLYDIELPPSFKKYVEKKKENYQTIHSKIKTIIERKYLKRKQRRDDKLAGRISLEKKIEENVDERKKRKKKKKKR